MRLLRFTIPIALAWLAGPLAAAADEVAGPTPEQAKAIAEETFIFAYPMLENYKTMFITAAYPQSKTFQAPFNRFHHFRKFVTPEFTSVVSPNNDTLYSMAWLDLRAEPMVLTLPEVKGKRYFSFQLVDAFTFNFAYIGARTTGWKAGSYLIAGPGWQGEAPEGVELIRSNSQFVFLLGRTAVDGMYDLRNAHYLQDRYKLATFSYFSGTSAPRPAARLDFPMWNTPLSRTAAFVGYLNFILRFVEPYPEAKALLARAAAIGVGAGRHNAPGSIDPTVMAAAGEGVDAAYAKIEEKSKNIAPDVNGWNLLTDGFGTREMMEGKDLLRAAAAMFGLYGNTLEEAYYPRALRDGEGRPLDGSKFDYTLRFEKDELPSVRAFWSITMYRLPEQQLVVNRLKRYAIGSRDKDLVYDEDGSLTLRLQHESPGAGLETNWLPAPDGPFSLILRMYWPRRIAIGDPPYAPPPLVGTALPERPDRPEPKSPPAPNPAGDDLPDDPEDD